MYAGVCAGHEGERKIPPNFPPASPRPSPASAGDGRPVVSDPTVSAGGALDSRSLRRFRL